ncbi:MAG: hypothetical protein LCH32_07190 [Bacteroidetes bacterium]|nr:hypothetical protein [Bacteroidota bacterium]
MKTISKILCVGLLSTSILSAQEDQTAKATKMGEGKFLCYKVFDNSGTLSYDGIDDKPWSLTFKPFQENLKEVVVQKEESNDIYRYYPDEEGYPCTYILGYKDNAKYMVGYDYIDYRSHTRLVFLDEWVYILTKWENKDRYEISKCFKKGEAKGLKLMKLAMSSSKTMEEAKHKEALKKYFDEAFKKQEEVLPGWKEKNKALVDKKQAGKDRYKFCVDSINGRYWGSAEGQKKKAQWAQSPVYIYNDTNVEFLMCHGQGVSTFLKPGEKKEFSCSGGGKVYKGTKRPNNNTQLDKTDQLLLDLNGQNCGKTYNASSFK